MFGGAACYGKPRRTHGRLATGEDGRTDELCVRACVRERELCPRRREEGQGEEGEGEGEEGEGQGSEQNPPLPAPNPLSRLYLIYRPCGEPLLRRRQAQVELSRQTPAKSSLLR